MKIEANKKTDSAKILIFPLRIKSIYTPMTHSITQKTKETAFNIFSLLSASRKRQKKPRSTSPPSRPFIGRRLKRAYKRLVYAKKLWLLLNIKNKNRLPRAPARETAICFLYPAVSPLLFISIPKGRRVSEDILIFKNLITRIWQSS